MGWLVVAVVAAGLGLWPCSVIRAEPWPGASTGEPNGLVSSFEVFDSVPDVPGVFAGDIEQPQIVSSGMPSVSTHQGLCRDCPTWSIQVDALMLWQGAIPSRPFYLDTDDRSTVLDANDLQTPVTAAPRYAIIYNRDDCRSFELNYFNLWGFGGQAVTPLSQAGYEMNDLAGLNFDDIDAAAADSQASIKSLEFNLRRVGWGGVRWLTGFRWIEWNQQLAMIDRFNGDINPQFDLLGVATLNNLYGWQWGGDLMLWNRGESLRVNGVAKAGVYYNHQAGQRTVYVNDEIDPVGVANAKDAVSFMGETGVNFSYSLTNWLSWRAGYTFMWLGGVATPANQLDVTQVNPDLTPEANVSPYGSVLLHGVTTGLEARW
jgi:hypothetical protein